MRSSRRLVSIAYGDVDLLGDTLRLGADEVHREEAVSQVRAHDLHAVGEEEGALELARRDPAMHEDARLVVDLTAADDKLVLLDGDVELVARKAGDGESDAKPLRRPLWRADPLDVVGRVAVIGGFGDPIERPLDLVEAKQER